MRITGPVLFIGAVAVTVAAGVALPAASAVAPGRDRPPECVTVPIAQSAGTAWVRACGGGAGGESPWQGWAPKGAVTVDGFNRLIPPAKCPRLHPCTLFAEDSPQS